MVTRKICPELFLISVFDPCISPGPFLDGFLSCKKSTYTQINTVICSANTALKGSPSIIIMKAKGTLKKMHSN